MEKFNIRVYGVLINEEKKILVADEFIRGKYYTKFPGGGLELGEGTRDCLKREFKEELDIDVAIGDHIYTTDFFQLSAFNPAHQIISIYYYVNPLEEIKSARQQNEFIPVEKNHLNDEEIDSFRFIDWDFFSDESVTLPIDKIVAKLVKSV
jgi:ADP-ribose pyrophosphatase YjhB (NUDIX family)